MKISEKTQAHTRYRLRPTHDWPKGEISVGVTTVTNILAKPALLPWANRLGLQGIEVGKYVDDKADIGTLAHDMVISDLLGKVCDTSDYSANQIDQAQNAALSFWNWQKHNDLQILSAEEPLVHPVHRYGGQYDIYGEVGGFFELIDLKTGSGIWEEHYYQVAGYAMLLEEGQKMNDNWQPSNRKIDRIRILNIPRSEDENFQEVILSGSVITEAKEMFLDCLRIYRRKQKIGKMVKR